MEKAIELDQSWTALGVERVPDEEWSAMEFQPSERPRAGTIELTACRGKLRHE
jgi:hypothetical protein